MKKFLLVLAFVAMMAFTSCDNLDLFGGSDEDITGVNIETYHSMNVGETIKIDVTFYPEGVASPEIVWNIVYQDPSDAISISDDGVLSALKEGKAEIEVCLKENSSISARCQVVINPYGGSDVTDGLSLADFSADSYPNDSEWTITDNEATTEDFYGLRAALNEASDDRREISLNFPNLIEFPAGALLSGFKFDNNYVESDEFKGEYDDMSMYCVVSISADQATKAGDYAFDGNDKLYDVDMPNLQFIGKHCFAECDRLSDVDFNNLLEIGESAFLGTALRNVRFANAQKVGKSAFSYLKELVDISLPEAKEVDSYAFRGCENLLSVYLPKVEEVGSYAFESCYKISSVELESAKKLGSFVFRSCVKLEDLVIPNVEEIGNGLFHRCDVVDRVVVNSDYFCVENKVLYNADKTVALCGFIFNYDYTKNNNYYLPSSVKEIAPYAFAYDGSVYFYMSGVEKIGANAFYNAALSDARSTDNVKVIESGAFTACYGLGSASFANVDTIGSGAFQRCDGITYAYIPRATWIGDNVFSGCSEMNKIVMGCLKFHDFSYLGQFGADASNIELCANINCIGYNHVGNKFYYDDDTVWGPFKSFEHTYFEQ